LEWWYIPAGQQPQQDRGGRCYNIRASQSNLAPLFIELNFLPMTIAFISDLHLTPDFPESTAWFREFATEASRQLQQLYILGDLFEFWIGDDGSEILGQTAAEEIMKELTRCGVEIFFMHGNRDFLVGEDFARRTGCTILPDPSIIELGGEPVLLTHGDTLCIDDVEHQEKRAQMVTSKWKIAFLDKPIDIRLDTANRMRSESETGKKTKSMKIMDVNQGHLEKVMREHGVHTLIHGHTHRPAVHEFMIDNQSARRFVLGDWYTQKSMLLFENGSYSLRM
jgi:UDP-2,3-diacylglucosamine hydrolase